MLSLAGAGCVLAGSVAAFVPAASAAATTLVLSPITSSTGATICDAQDENPKYADVACDSELASAYFGSDGTLLGAAIVLAATPFTTTGQQPPVESTTYVVQLGVDGAHTASIGVDGKGTGDTDYVYAGCAGAAAPTYSKLASAAIADGSLVFSPNADGTTRMTFTVPLSALAPCGITARTSLAPYVGTSQAGPLDNINKDFFLGNAVSFGSINRPPVAEDDTASAVGGGPAQTVPVLGNDNDADGDPLVVTSVGTAGTLGTVSVAADGRSVSYTPPAVVPAATATTFTYDISDGKGGTDRATVTVTLTPAAAVNRPPAAEDDTASAVGGGPAQTLLVLGNDSDADGDPLVVTAVGAAGTLGAVSVAGDGGSVSYPPPAVVPAVTTTTFTYDISDGKGGTDRAVVTVTLTPAAPTTEPTTDPTTDPTVEPTTDPTVAPSPIQGTTGPDPATTEEPTREPTQDPTQEAQPVAGTTEQPATLPFTGGSTDLLLGAGAGLSVLGLMLALTGRRRRLVE